MEPFKIQFYTKKELGLMYFPESSPRAASAHLVMWLKRNRQLMEMLLLLGYRPTDKCFTPLQVKAIVDCLGEP